MYISSTIEDEVPIVQGKLVWIQMSNLISASLRCSDESHYVVGNNHFLRPCSPAILLD